MLLLHIQRQSQYGKKRPRGTVSQVIGMSPMSGLFMPTIMSGTIQKIARNSLRRSSGEHTAGPPNQPPTKETPKGPSARSWANKAHRTRQEI